MTIAVVFALGIGIGFGVGLLLGMVIVYEKLEKERKEGNL